MAKEQLTGMPLGSPQKNSAKISGEVKGQRRRLQGHNWGGTMVRHLLGVQMIPGSDPSLSRQYWLWQTKDLIKYKATSCVHRNWLSWDPAVWNFLPFKMSRLNSNAGKSEWHFWEWEIICKTRNMTTTQIDSCCFYSGGQATDNTALLCAKQEVFTYDQTTKTQKIIY